MTEFVGKRSRPAEVDRFQGWLSRMAHVRRVPYLNEADYKAANLANFIIHPLRDFQDDLYQVATKQKKVEDIPKRVIILTGLPMSGKTYFENIVNEFIDDDIDKYKTWFEVRHTRVNWEKDGEDKARDKGYIQTPRDQSFNDQELLSCSVELTNTTKEAIINSHWVTLEVPANSAVKLDGYWRGRPLGTQLVYDLVRKEGEFEGLLYIPYLIGLIPGPLLRHIILYSREDFRSAQNLEEAAYFASLYGKTIPKNLNEWEDLKQGATPEQVRFIEKGVEELMNSIENRLLVRKPQKKIFPTAYPLEMSEVISEAKYYLDDYEIWASGVFVDFLFRHRGNFDLNDPKKRFIGYNSPTIGDLNITKIDELIAHLLKKKVNP